MDQLCDIRILIRPGGGSDLLVPAVNHRPVVITPEVEGISSAMYLFCPFIIVLYWLFHLHRLRRRLRRRVTALPAGVMD